MLWDAAADCSLEAAVSLPSAMPKSAENNELTASMEYRSGGGMPLAIWEAMSNTVMLLKCNHRNKGTKP